ncbi:MAG: site-specific integrase [Planctomycetota bacterium]|nr:MAG: site-specific integrase [Planctomycetota bacterium]
MPKLRNVTPKYRHHRASGQAVVTLDGRDFYLGRWKSTASKAVYERLIGEWLANGRRLSQTCGTEGLTVVELLAAYRRHARAYYRKNGKLTSTVASLDYAIRPLRQFYGRELVRDFGPLALQALQGHLSRGYVDAKGKPVAGLARRTVNDRIAAIKRVFRWGVSQELVPPSVIHALDAVPGLKIGRSEARETAPVLPVEDDVVEATLPHLPTVVADMVRLQRLTGCRPGEVCSLRPCDVDRSGDVWTYRPASHKTEHHGRDRVIFIGPRAQEILTPYLLRPATSHCFSPRESEKQRKVAMRAARTSKVPPSQVDRSKPKPMRVPSGRYGKDTYRRAIARACDKAGVPHWSPNRLRHTAATSIRRQFGLEAAQVALGHSTADVTQIYAERDRELGLRVALEVG